MKRILINASQPEELRVAIVDGQKLNDLDIEVPSSKQRKANVYKGKITRVEPSLEAAFVDYGSERHGFLPLKEVARSYFKQDPGGGRVNIANVLEEGQEVIVQVDKEERGNKGAALTTFLSLAGRYLVLMPNNPRAGGVSRRIEGDDRSELREAMADLEIPQGVGVIARTAGVGRSAEELQWDLDYLLQVWKAIETAASERAAPFLIYQESNVVIRALRDYLRKDIGEIIIDDEKVHQQAHDFMQQIMPNNLRKLKLYSDTIPLFSRFQIESQIESAFRRTVQLPSGGSLVIDHTEALVSIDINSSRATGGADIEETALNTNLEAADEIARQLRLRDMGGLIVIDFIDMSSNKAQRDVEERLREAVSIDRARIQIGRISRFGLLEMSRQRLRPSLGEHSHEVCPRCNGQGTIRNIESLALSVLRLVEEEALKDRTARVIALVPVSVGSFLLNEKRLLLSELEARCKTQLTVVPNEHMETPHYEVRRIRDDQMQEDDNSAESHELVAGTASPGDVEIITDRSRPVIIEEPAVRQVMPTTPAPGAAAPEQEETSTQRPGLLQRLALWFKTLFASAEEPARRSTQSSEQTQRSRQSQSGQQRRGNGRNQQQGNRRRNQQRRGDSENRSRGNRQGASGQKRDQSGAAKKPTGNEGRPSQQRNQAKPAASGSEAGGDNQTQDADSQQTAEQKNRDEGSNANRRRRGRRGGRRNRRGAQGEGQSTQAGTSSGPQDEAQESKTQSRDSGRDKVEADNKPAVKDSQPERPPSSPATPAESKTAKPRDDSSNITAATPSAATPPATRSDKPDVPRTQPETNTVTAPSTPTRAAAPAAPAAPAAKPESTQASSLVQVETRRAPGNDNSDAGSRSQESTSKTE